LAACSDLAGALTLHCHWPPSEIDALTAEELKYWNGVVAAADGPIKTFPLRGIKDSPPYFHDGRLLTLEDSVEFFNVILGTKLTKEEKQDLVAYLRCL